MDSTQATAPVRELKDIWPDTEAGRVAWPYVSTAVRRAEMCKDTPVASRNMLRAEINGMLLTAMMVTPAFHSRPLKVEADRDLSKLIQMLASRNTLLLLREIGGTLEPELMEDIRQQLDAGPAELKELVVWLVPE